MRTKLDINTFMTGEHNSPRVCRPPSTFGMVYHIYIYLLLKFTVPEQCSDVNIIKTEILLPET